MAAAADSDASFPSGSWTLYFHDPEDSSWSPDSYKKIGSFSDFLSLWGTMSFINTDRFLSGMFFLMRDPYPPMWENRTNIHGGSYCIKVPESQTFETFQRYTAAAIVDLATQDPKNTIVGISISPKKGFHILKIWNHSCKSYHAPSDLMLLGDNMRTTDIIYRPHVDQKF